MHVTLPKLNNETDCGAKHGPPANMLAAQKELDKLSIASKGQLKWESVQEKIQEISNKHKLPQKTHVHWHGKAKFCDGHTHDHHVEKNKKTPCGSKSCAEKKMLAAQAELDELGVSTAKQLGLPSIKRQIQEISEKHKLPKDVEVHWHGTKAEFCNAKHDHSKVSKLHQATGKDNEKKTSQDPHQKTDQQAGKKKGFLSFFKNFFSTAA